MLAIVSSKPEPGLGNCLELIPDDCNCLVYFGHTITLIWRRFSTIVYGFTSMHNGLTTSPIAACDIRCVVLLTKYSDTDIHSLKCNNIKKVKFVYLLSSCQIRIHNFKLIYERVLVDEHDPAIQSLFFHCTSFHVSSMQRKPNTN